MNPRAIATVGAGNNPLKMGAIQALSIVKDGYGGKFYPLHPVEEKVFGYRAYRSPFDLPEAPDLVMFVLPAPKVVPILDQFGQIGTRRAIIITAGFRETGAEGKRLEEELLATARKHGIRFLGPNCMGVINSHISLNVTVLPFDTAPGPLGMVSQSGTYITQTLPYLQKRGIRFSKAVSVGNEADLNLVDALEYLGSDEQTGAIALYIEGLQDAGRFLEVARKITPRKAVIAQYVGGSQAGARAGSSHTGAMAGPDYLYNGLFKQAGVIRVDSIEELYNQGWALATQPPLKGRRIAVLTNSGGPGTAIAHTCNSGGLEVPRFSEATREKIKPLLPPHGAVGNPVDLTFLLDVDILSTKLPQIVMESGEVDGIVMHGLMSTGFMKAVFPHIKTLLGFEDEEQFLAQFIRDLTGPVALPGRHQVPLVVSSFFGREDIHTATYQDHNIPVFDAPEKAARAMLALYHHSLIRKRPPHQPAELPPKQEEAAAIIAAAVKSKQQYIDEYSSKRILAAYGVPVGEEQLASTADQAAAAAAAIGYPVVLKACAPTLAHKSEAGLIALNIMNETELRKAYSDIAASTGQDIGFLVAKMIKGDREMMAGAVRHPAFGAAVMFGLGGIFAETLGDRTFRLAPLTVQDALEMLDDLRSAALLDATRGLPAADRHSLAGILQAIGSIALLHPEIEAIDLNPLLISGSGPVAVDALIELKSG